MPKFLTTTTTTIIVIIKANTNIVATAFVAVDADVVNDGTGDMAYAVTYDIMHV